MHAFRYRRPHTLAEALAVLREEPEAKALAGGMSLLSAMKLRLAQPSHLVDLRTLPGLAGIQADRQWVEIGAMTRHADVAASAAVRSAIPALSALAGGIGDRQVRNRGTIGGSVANNDPAADYPAALLGLGATVVTDRRSVPADGFFLGLFETALAQDELIRTIRFPVPRRAAYVKFHQPASRFALVGVFVAETQGGEIRVAVTGAGPCVFRAGPIEAALSRTFTPEAAEAAVVPADALNSDMHGDAEYRAHLVPVLAARAVERLRGGDGPTA
jgi:carbon-monoxide dehydrogenase medium subunit